MGQHCAEQIPVPTDTWKVSQALLFVLFRWRP